MRRSTVWKLLFISALGIVVPLMAAPKPTEASCYCNTYLDCQRCFNTEEPIACGVVSPHVCTWL